MTTSTRSFWDRQLGFLAERGMPMDSAIARLVSAGVSQPVPDAGTVEPWRRLLRKLDLGSAVPHAELAFDAARSEIAMRMAPVWSAYRGVALHFALVAAVSVLVVHVLGIYVLPQWSQTYRSFGADLPAATRMLMSHGGSAALPVPLLLLTVVFWWLPNALRRAVELRRRPVPAWLSGVLMGPGHSDVWVVYELSLVRACTRAGMTMDAALLAVAGFARGWHGRPIHWPIEWQQQACVASDLGTLDDELAFQLACCWQKQPLGSVARREWIAVAVTLLLGLVVGFLLVALYLPIFRLSSVL